MESLVAVVLVSLGCMLAGWIASLVTERLERQKRRKREISMGDLTHDEMS